VPAARVRGIALASAAIFCVAHSSNEAVAEPLRLVVASASVEPDPRHGRPNVAVRLTDDSRRHLASFSEVNLGRTVDFQIDGKSAFKPVIRESITGGTFLIPMEELGEAYRLAERLSSKAATLAVEAASN
jgi:preprotein translocase subunit SecD